MEICALNDGISYLMHSLTDLVCNQFLAVKPVGTAACSLTDTSRTASS